jgi:opine dehydrogenase
MSGDAIGIIGAGNSAHALAAYLSSQGHRVTMFARNPAKISKIAASKQIVAVGKVEGTFPINFVTDDYAVLAKHSRTIFLATVTTAYRAVTRALAPHLTSDHAIVAFSSKLCGSLEVQSELLASGVQGVKVIETDALFACRIRDDGAIWIRGFKNWNLYACPTWTETKEYGPLLSRYFPGLEPARNLIQRGLTDFGAVAHAVITLANISRIDRQDEFLFYYEGLSERTVVLLEAMEREFQAVAAAYGTEIISLTDLLNRYYGCETETLYKAMTSVPNYRHSLAPKSLDHRYLQEDVACTLVPVQQLALKAGIKTPMTDSVINLASIIGGQEFSAVGRHLGGLGWDGLTRDQIIAWMAQ